MPYECVSLCDEKEFWDIVSIVGPSGPKEAKEKFLDHWKAEIQKAQKEQPGILFGKTSSVSYSEFSIGNCGLTAVGGIRVDPLSRALVISANGSPINIKSFEPGNRGWGPVYCFGAVSVAIDGNPRLAYKFSHSTVAHATSLAAAYKGLAESFNKGVRSAYLMSDTVYRTLGMPPEPAGSTRGFCDWLKKNNFGKLISSPVMINPVHKTKTDFSLIQIWTWIPPKSEELCLRTPDIRTPEIWEGIPTHEQFIKQHARHPSGWQTHVKAAVGLDNIV